MNNKVKKSPKKKLQLDQTVCQKTISKKYKKNAKRRSRRKKSKRTYYSMLKNERIVKNADDLCDRLQEFSVVDCNMKPMCEMNQLPPEITEWQNQDQIAYWKSRAITLEIENKMLRKHLRNVYTQQIEYYQQPQWQEITHNDTNDLPQTSQPEKECVNTLTKSETEPEPMVNRLKEMEKIYGDKAAKIMGMETAIQLNYEKLVEEGSLTYWPNVAINL
ncbi:gem-associated protein 8-like [Anthonomus grandis grandis]|uniref:gem-associated protein 8-like n=1 Tax=Anthonomus grandis grandis TaxID=2921223 RepID=UPI0021666FCE|nr:gem-associated protein 8-like [Anthonomus grandis grandis]